MNDASFAVEPVITNLATHWKLISGIGSAVVACAKILPIAARKIGAILDRRLLIRRVGGDLYTRADLIRATTHYVIPYCQSIDPSGSEDFRQTVAVRQNAHEQMTDLLDPKKDEKFFLVLADTGMGKTTLLLNYFALYCRRGAFAVSENPDHKSKLSVGG